MRATEILMQEHRGIEEMLTIIEAAAQRLEQKQDVPSFLFVDAVDFFRGFADACHHAKEEEELFVTLEERGLPRSAGPTGIMLAEHQEGRRYIRALADATQGYVKGDATTIPQLVANARGYATLLRQHIAKEDQILFPLADRMLSSDDRYELVIAFDAIEAQRTGVQEHERYHRMIAHLQQVVAGWNA
jgi:hemerythrin-like domain-containing protein